MLCKTTKAETKIFSFIFIVCADEPFSAWRLNCLWKWRAKSFVTALTQELPTWCLLGASFVFPWLFFSGFLSKFFPSILFYLKIVVLSCLQTHCHGVCWWPLTPLCHSLCSHLEYYWLFFEKERKHSSVFNYFPGTYPPYLWSYSFSIFFCIEYLYFFLPPPSLYLILKSIPSGLFTVLIFLSLFRTFTFASPPGLTAHFRLASNLL